MSKCLPAALAITIPTCPFPSTPYGHLIEQYQIVGQFVTV